MIDALIQLGLFFIQTFTLVIAVLLLIAGIMAIVTKGKLKEKTRIKVRKLNKYYSELRDKLNEAMLSKDELKAAEKTLKKQKKSVKKKGKKETTRVFVISFNGDMKASAVTGLREEITAILTVAKPTDEVVVKLESAGGLAHSYGLAASELQRIKDKEIKLTIAVDKVAASGGYMMACVADQLLAAPFAIIGSIGVVAQLPNFNKLLKKHDVDYEMITAGEYKRTLTVFGENTPQGKKKVQEEVDEIHGLFKDFIKEHRPNIDLKKVATGEHWFAKRALDYDLVDKLITSDDYLLQASQESALYEISYKKKKKFSEKFTASAHSAFKSCLFTWRQKEIEESLFL